MDKPIYIVQFFFKEKEGEEIKAVYSSEEEADKHLQALRKAINLLELNNIYGASILIIELKDYYNCSEIN